MPRITTVKINQGTPAKLALKVYHNETHQIDFDTPGLSLIFVVAINAGSEPVVEIPSAVASTITLTPLSVASLAEGGKYSAEVWDVTDAADPRVVASGDVTLVPTITPVGVDYPAQFLEGGQTIVAMTQVDYDAIVTPETETVYAII